MGESDAPQPTEDRAHRGARRLSNALLVCAVLLAAVGVDWARRGPAATGDVVQVAGGPPLTESPTVADAGLRVEVEVARAALPPDGVRIDAVGVSAPTVPVGLAPDGSLAVPPPGSTGWYSLGVRPGEAGYAVIAGHVDNHHGPDVFYRLRDLRAGDVVVVKDAAGGELRFVVESVEQQAKVVLPETRMWAPASRPMLALITCGGTFDKKRRTYLDNVVVYAALADSTDTVPQDHPIVAAAVKSS